MSELRKQPKFECCWNCRYRQENYILPRYSCSLHEDLDDIEPTDICDDFTAEEDAHG